MCENFIYTCMFYTYTILYMRARARTHVRTYVIYEYIFFLSKLDCAILFFIHNHHRNRLVSHP